MSVIPIMVWRWEDAPSRFRELSTHGGDEDWVALIPKEQWEREGVPLWAETGTTFGCCDVYHYVLEGGCAVLIGAHA